MVVLFLVMSFIGSLLFTNHLRDLLCGHTSEMHQGWFITIIPKSLVFFFAMALIMGLMHGEQHWMAKTLVMFPLILIPMNTAYRIVIVNAAEQGDRIDKVQE